MSAVRAMREWTRSVSKAWLAAGLLCLALSGVVQQHVQARRIEAKLTWSDPEQHGGEAGFLALGGFRGILADILWVRATRHKDSGRYYELKLLCDMILKLQPTFTQVHAFQADNFSYNLAYRAESCDDKWYWIRSGIVTLENGLQRNSKHYSLWFSLGFTYFDRLGDAKLREYQTGKDCRSLRMKELPNLDALTEAQRRAVFLNQESWKDQPMPDGSPRPLPREGEHLRFAAYYFWKSLETATESAPLRTERMYGQCIERLGHFRSKVARKEDRRTWDDWGAEEWWVELRERNKNPTRGLQYDTTVPINLTFCMYQQIDLHLKAAERQQQLAADERRQSGSGSLVLAEARAAAAEADAQASLRRVQDCYERFRIYFPERRESLEEVVKLYRGYMAQPGGGRRVREALEEPPPPQ